MPGTGRLLAERKLFVFTIRWRGRIFKQKHRPRRLHSIPFRWEKREVDFTFGFDRGPVLSAAVRNVLDAKIAQNLVQVRGVDEHVLNGEGLHGALSVPTLASLLQPPVKSVIGAAFVTQTSGWWRRRRWRCLTNREENRNVNEAGAILPKFCVRFHAGALRSATALEIRKGECFHR